MYIISISHKTAPVGIRELFSFTAKEQEEFIGQAMKNGHIGECVLLSTCNRSEVYFTGDPMGVSEMEKLLSEFKKEKLELLLKYFLVYNEEKAMRHLFLVTCGMDSMVIGEDEILGQVKEAYARALHLGATGYLLNTLFQAAITCAKRIKTDTRLSKTPVSIGTLAANEVFNFPKEQKCVLIIGLTGKMGTIIMKNLYGKSNIRMIGTSRSHNLIETIGQAYDKVTMIDYKLRYRYMDQADIIISATSSPHYTVTGHELSENLHTDKERLFLDLAVPMDIDKDIVKLGRISIHDIDYFNQASRENTQVKEQETVQASLILEEHLDAVKKELAFRAFVPDIPKLGRIFENRSLESVLYEIKDRASSEELTVLVRLLEKLNG